MKSKWKSITWLCVCQVLAMTLWFSATALIPAFRASGLTSFRASLLTSGVQAGFVVGTLISATLGLADRLDPRRFFMLSSFAAATANAGIIFLEPQSLGMPVLRFLTGICLAGIYPVGMKMAASWANRDTGLLVGLLVGALTLGSATPHLLIALGGMAWQTTLLAASSLAATGGMLVWLVQIGPNWKPAAKFKPSLVLEAMRNRALRYANFGYFGHMWELYAVWASVGLFLTASFSTHYGAAEAPLYARIATFATVASGVLGCLLAGYVADRVGRTTVTIAALGISGLCSLLVGFLFGGNPLLLMTVCIVWGVSVVADSAQFSASIAELSDPTIVGTMLTVQTSIGFLITFITIHLTPHLAEVFGWRYAFAPLALGPAVGILAMARLRSLPEARRLAGGNR